MDDGPKTGRRTRRCTGKKRRTTGGVLFFKKMQRERERVRRHGWDAGVSGQCVAARTRRVIREMLVPSAHSAPVTAAGACHSRHRPARRDGTGVRRLVAAAAAAHLARRARAGGGAEPMGMGRHAGGGRGRAGGRVLSRTTTRRVEERLPACRPRRRRGLRCAGLRLRVGRVAGCCRHATAALCALREVGACLCLATGLQSTTHRSDLALVFFHVCGRSPLL